MTSDSSNKKASGPEIEKGFTLQVLTDKQIEAYSIPKDQLWYILVKGEPVGPFHRDDLRAFLEENTTFPRDTKVANYVDQKWLPLFKIPDFQRRRPQLVPKSEIMGNKDYFLLKGGQKVGPFSMEYLSQKIDRKEILFNDLMSIDSGETWIKIYEHPHFDRRNRENSGAALPFRPEDDAFSKSSEEVLQELRDKMMGKDEEEGLIGLAFIGKLKSKEKATCSASEDDQDYMMEGQGKNLSGSSQGGAFKKSLKFVGVGLLVVLVGGLLYSKFHGGPSSRSQGRVEENMASGESSEENGRRAQDPRLRGREGNSQDRVPSSEEESSSPLQEDPLGGMKQEPPPSPEEFNAMYPNEGTKGHLPSQDSTNELFQN